ncbi:MAG: RIP metalloprotease RseP [Nitrospirota bacterium]
MLTIISAIVLLGILIFVHELGHFLAAKRLGVSVLKFSLGFGPKVVGKKIGETEYLISAFPLGGYVKMLGEDPAELVNPSDANSSFMAQRVWKRTLIVFTGPLSNLLFAVIIFTGIFILGIPVLTSKVGNVLEDSPAMSAGIQEDDRITAINGIKVNKWTEMVKIVQRSEGKALRLTIQRDNRTFDIELTPKKKITKNIFGEDKEVWMMGISASKESITERSDPLTAVVNGVSKTIEITTLTVIGIIKIFQRIVPTETIGGPILIAQMAGEQAAHGFMSFMIFMAIISINLGVLNLLPIPILDGGHLLFLGIEKIMGKPLSMRKREIAQQIGLFLLISLMIFAFYNDIVRLFEGRPTIPR